MPSRYVIGIDLGTTNTAVGWVDTHEESPTPKILPLLQITEVGERSERDTVPSFLFLPDGADVPEGALDLPWAERRDFSVGALARKNASTMPNKVISSAKSWLCASNVDRTAAILPWNRENPERQISPVEAARRILEHIRDVWNATFPEADARFADQDVMLTVPASFDAVARELTVKAATDAGLAVTLLEEPQAAFYAWLHTHDSDWRTIVAPGERVLVCDIGGGTTDFSLIEVIDDDGNMGLKRVAVGDHILLGGDNMDLAMAYTVANRLRQERGIELEQWQIMGLTHACREAKEVLLNDPEAPPQKLTVLGRGSSVIGGTISTDLSFQDIEELMLDGFFPVCEVTDQPSRGTSAGLRTFGLDYAQDAAITKHLAAFLVKHCAESELPTAILFNGGVSKANLLKERIITTVNSWIDGGELSVLPDDQPDLAVALGAGWYGYVRRGNAIRIKAGSPQSYYVGIESSMPAVPGFTPPVQALCVIPFNLEEGLTMDVPYTGLGLVVGAETTFRFFASNARTDDQPGVILSGVGDLDELPALVGKLDVESSGSPGTLVPVTLRTVLTEVGTIQVWCDEESGERSWRLDYQVRGLQHEGDSSDDG